MQISRPFGYLSVWPDSTCMLAGVHKPCMQMHANACKRCVTQRELRRPGTTKENNTPKNTCNQPGINPNYCQLAQFTDRARGTIEKAAHESSCITPTSTSTMHTKPWPATTSLWIRLCNHTYIHTYHTNPAGSSLESSRPTQLSSRRRAQPHSYTHTTRNSGDTRHPPPDGGRHLEELVVSHGCTA